MIFLKSYNPLYNKSKIVRINTIDFQNHGKFERSLKDRSNRILNCFIVSIMPNHFYLKNYIVYWIYLSKMIY